jgi:WD40 repeat protein
MRILQWHEGPVRAVAYSPGGEWLASGGNDHRIRLWRLAAEGKHSSLAGHEDWVRGLAFSPGGKFLSSAGWDDLVKTWSLAGRTLQTAGGSHSGGAWSLAYSPAGDTLVTGAGDGTISFHQPGKQNPRSRRQHHRPVSALAFVPGGKLLVSASHDRTVKLWDGTWWEYKRTLQTHEDWVRAVAVSADGELVGAGNDAGVILLSTLPQGEAVARIAGHDGPVAGLAFAAGGRSLLSVGWDGTARRWDVPAGRERQAYEWGVGKLLCLAASPDGMTAAAGGETGEVVVWDAEE